MSTTTEQRNSSIQQDGSNQRCIGNTSQAFDATLKAPYKKIKLCVNILYQESKKKDFALEKHFLKLKTSGQREIRLSKTTHKRQKICERTQVNSTSEFSQLLLDLLNVDRPSD